MFPPRGRLGLFRLLLTPHWEHFLGWGWPIQDLVLEEGQPRGESVLRVAFLEVGGLGRAHHLIPPWEPRLFPDVPGEHGRPELKPE